MGQTENTYLTKHRQIIDAITQAIEENRIHPNDRLPSEKELCEKWKTSRSTVRKAMDQLADRGIVVRVPGKGSFAAFPKISHQTSQVMSFSEKMRAQGLEVETKLIRKEIVDPGEEISAMLKMNTPARTIKIQRLRIVKGEPIALQTAFIPAYVCENLIKADFETQSLNRLLEQNCNIRLSRSDIWVEAPILSKKEKVLLGNPRLPLFLAVVGVTFDQTDKPVRYSRGILRGDRIRVKISDSGLFELDYPSLLG